MDLSSATASGSALLNPSSRPTAIGKNVVITTSMIFGSMPKPIHSTSSGAIAIVGMVCVATSSGITACSSVWKRSITQASPNASAIPISRPRSASVTETNA